MAKHRGTVGTYRKNRSKYTSSIHSHSSELANYLVKYLIVVKKISGLETYLQIGIFILQNYKLNQCQGHCT